MCVPAFLNGWVKLKIMIKKIFLRYPDLKCIVGILVLSFLVAFPVLNDKFYKAHDLKRAFTNAVAMREAWANGDVLARWTPEIIQGYGYPTFNFYTPLFFYITAAIACIVPMILAFNLAIFFIIFASGLTMYLFAKEFWGRDGGFVSAAAYLFAPYHILDLYVRGSMAESLAFVFFPLILWAVYRLAVKTDTAVFVIGILASAGLFLSHNISTMIFFPFAVLYAFFLFWTGGMRWQGFLMALVMFSWGMMIAAYFLIPAVFEKPFVQIDRAFNGYYDFGQHFLYFDQLLYSPWGYGSSNPGHSDGMSFMVGPIHVLLSLAAVLGIGRLKAGAVDSVRQVIFFIFMIVAAGFFVMEVSLPVWEHLPFLRFAQFPWRFLMLMALAFSFLSGGIVHVVGKQWRAIAGMTAVCFIVVMNVSFCRVSGYEDVGFNSRTDYLYHTTPMDNREYLPKWVYRFSYQPLQKLQIIKGGAMVEEGKRSKGIDRRYRVRVFQTALFCYHTHYFPGWRVLIDGINSPILFENGPGLIMFNMPLGEHDLRIYFGQTPIRRLAELISMIAFFILVCVFIFRQRIDRLLFRSAALA